MVWIHIASTTSIGSRSVLSSDERNTCIHGLAVVDPEGPENLCIDIVDAFLRFP
jgi:hypothetical protein